MTLTYELSQTVAGHLRLECCMTLADGLLHDTNHWTLDCSKIVISGRLDDTVLLA
jgi:hypothetical protein